MNYALNDGITIVVDKGQGPGLVGDGQGELVVIHQADLLNLAGVVHVVQEDGDAQHFKGQLISKCPFGVIKLTKKPTEIKSTK